MNDQISAEALHHIYACIRGKRLFQTYGKLKKVEEVKEAKNSEINADWLIYQTLEDLIDTAKSGNPDITEFETSIFTGEYITPLVENYLEELENSRKDELKTQREKSKANG